MQDFLVLNKNIYIYVYIYIWVFEVPMVYTGTGVVSFVGSCSPTKKKWWEDFFGKVVGQPTVGPQDLSADSSCDGTKRLKRLKVPQHHDMAQVRKVLLTSCQYLESLAVPNCWKKSPNISDRYLKWRNHHLYKLYGYGLCKGKPTQENSLICFRKPSILGTNETFGD